jgi:magnesium chelatase accessory protein
MNAVANSLIWDRDGRDWPHRDSSRFVRAAGMSWHVQEMGEGPDVLLLHGTGASTHSWRALAPLLAARFRVIALDLPGHGFTQAAPREFLSLYGMTLATDAVLQRLDRKPMIIVGHSAGAAVAVRLSIGGYVAPRAIIGINAALMPLRGVASHFFAPLARALSRLPLVPNLFAQRALDRSLVTSMIEHTGSTLDREGIDLYWKLAQSPGHIAAAFGMMAEWDLPRLAKELPDLKTPLVLLVGMNDKTIRPIDAKRVRAILPSTTIVPLEGLGHLAHEEEPELVAHTIFLVAKSVGVLLDEE